MENSSWKAIAGLLGSALVLACAYHGVKRNCGSVGWGLGWALFGATTGPVAPIVAWAQGFATPLPSCRR